MLIFIQDFASAEILLENASIHFPRKLNFHWDVSRRFCLHNSRRSYFNQNFSRKSKLVHMIRVIDVFLKEDSNIVSPGTLRLSNSQKLQFPKFPGKTKTQLWSIWFIFFSRTNIARGNWPIWLSLKNTREFSDFFLFRIPFLGLKSWLYTIFRKYIMFNFLKIENLNKSSKRGI